MLKSIVVVSQTDVIQGAAIKVESGPAGRVTAGPVQPVVVITDSDLQENGGAFYLTAGEPVKVFDAAGVSRNLVQGKPIVVYDVNGSL